MEEGEEMSLIGDLIVKEKRLRKDLGKVLDEIRAEKLRIVQERYGIKVGSIVITKGEEYRITEIDTHWDPPWVSGNPKKKDGTWSKAVRNIYGDWKVID